MINHFNGILDSKSPDSVVVEAGGVGYRVHIPSSTYERLPEPGGRVRLYIVESVAMYGGSTSYYGFFSEQERDVFSLLKEVPGAGAKKALDYLDKVNRSLADFCRAVSGRDAATLTSVFGFTKKTADKLVAALKDKVAAVAPAGGEAWQPAAPAGGARAEAVAGLVALGYRETQARNAVDKALGGAEGLRAVEDIIREALRHLAA